MSHLLTLPPTGDRPERYHAARQLERAGVSLGRVIEVLAAGAPDAALDAQGKPRETVLYVDGDGTARHALLMDDDRVLTRPGW